MKISENGINLIKSFEGLVLHAYKALWTEKYYTIGYGHYGPDVKSNQKISEQKAVELLKNDLKKFESYVNIIMSDFNLKFNQNQFDVLVSFAYNCGYSNLRNLTKNRNIEQIGNAISLYNKSGGQVLNGLVKRRAKEKDIYFNGYFKIENIKKDEKENITKIAENVIKGVYGNGVERKLNIEKLGYDYNEIQKKVNEIIKGK